MRLVISQTMSLDGVVQAPGAPEDTDGGYAHGGWSMPYFDPEVMGGFVDETMKATGVLCCVYRPGETPPTYWES